MSHGYVALVYGERLDGGSRPAAGDFSVSVRDSVTGIVSRPEVARVDVDFDYVALTLSGRARHGDAVAVSYVPGADPIQDAAANPAAALGGHRVVNNTGPSNNAVLRGIGLSGVEVVALQSFERVSRWSSLSGYSVSVGAAVSVTTVTASPADSRASVQVTPRGADSATAGDQVALAMGLNTVAVTVTAEDGKTTATHIIEVTRGDVTAPELVSAAALHGYVALRYGEALDEGSQPAAGDFAVSVTDSVTGTVWRPEVAGVDVDGVYVSLRLSELVRHGDAVAVSYVPGADPIQDAAANPAAAVGAHRVVNTTAASDDAALSALELSGVELLPVFDAATAAYTALVGEAVSETTVAATAADPRASVQVTAGDSDGAQIELDMGPNTIVVTVTAEDATTTRAHTVTVTRADVAAPELVSGTVEGDRLVLVYGETLGDDSDPDSWDYTVAVTSSVTGGVQQRDVDDAYVEGATVVLTLLERVRHGDTVAVSYTSYWHGAVQDATGNHVADFGDHPVVNTTAASDDALLDVLMLSDDALVNVLMLSDVELSPAFDPETTSYSASVPHEEASVTVVALADLRAHVRVTTDAAAVDGGRIDLDVGPNTITVAVTAEDGATTRAYTIEVTRAAQPKLITATISQDQVVLVYDKALDEHSQPAPEDYTVTVTDSATATVSQPDVTGVDIDGTDVTLTLAEPARTGDTVTASYAPGDNPVRDSAGADAAALVGRPVTNGTAESDNSELSDLELSDAEGSGVELSPAFTAAATAYTASVQYQVASATVAATAADPRAKVQVTTDNGTPADADKDTPDDADKGTPADAGDGARAGLVVGPNTITVTVTAEDGTTSTYTLEVTRADATALDTATVDGAGVVLAYGESLDGGSEPAPEDFTVTVTDAVTGEESQPEVAAVSVAGSDVALTLSEPVRHADTVTVSYAPGAAPVKDATGNHAAALEDHPLVNDTAAAADAALSGLELSGAEGSGTELSGVELSPVFASAVTAYTASVLEAVSEATVAAATVDPRASVQVSTDDDAAVEGGRVPLVVGPNTITVTVTAEDGATTSTYTVVVTRAGAPMLDSATAFETQVVLSFDEPLNNDRWYLSGLSVPAAIGDFTVSVINAATGIVWEPSVTSVWVRGGSQVRLYLGAPGLYFADTVTIDYTPGSDPQIFGVDGNAAAGFSGYPAFNVTAPRGDQGLRALELSDVELAPGFSRYTGSYTASVGHLVSTTTITAATVDASGSVRVAPGDDDIVTPGDQVDLDVGSNTITVTVPGRSGYSTVAYTVVVTRAPNTGGPDLDTATVNGTGAVLSYDEALDTATVDGTGVVLSYDEPLDEGSVPAADDFAVSVTDSVTGAVWAPEVTGVSVSGSAVKLVLSATARYGDAVRVSYTPGAVPIEDLADGDDAAGFAGRSVTNLNSISADTTLSGLVLSGGDVSSVELSPALAVGTVDYAASVDNEVSSISVAATASDPRATRPLVTPADDDRNVFNGHQVPLEVGPNTITVTVTAEDGTTTGTHTVVVTRLPDTRPPQLRSATIDEERLVLFYDDVLNHDRWLNGLSVPAAIDDFTVSAVNAATGIVWEPRITSVWVREYEVRMYLAQQVYPGDTATIDYTPGADPQIYGLDGNALDGVSDHAVTNITIPSDDADLYWLGLSDVELSPKFSRDTAHYYGVAEEQVSTTKLSVAHHLRGSRQVTPADDDRALAGHQVRLEPGLNTITVTTTAEDRTTTRTYTATVSVYNDDAPRLASATAFGRNVTLTYSEALDGDSVPAAGGFTVSVTDAVTGRVWAPTVTGVSIVPKHWFDVSGVNDSVRLILSETVRHRDTVTISYRPGAKPVQNAAGVAANALSGLPLSNLTTKGITTTLESLEVSARSSTLAMIPAFDRIKTSYTTEFVAYGVLSVTVTATPDDPRATVSSSPADADSATPGLQVPLKVVGSNTITVTVTSEDGDRTYTYTVQVFRRAPRPLETLAVTSIDWDGFTAGVPSHHNADLAKDWLLSTLKYTLSNWWDEYKNFDDQSDDTYLDLAEADNSGEGGKWQQEKLIRESASMALALAVALSTGAYDEDVTDVSEATARARALKLIRSIAYRHDVNAPDSQTSGRWGYHWQSAHWAAQAGFAGWMLWDYLPAADKAYVKKMIVAEADEYRSPLYYRDQSGTIRFTDNYVGGGAGDSKTEEQAWNAYVLSLAAVMMPDHVNAPTWKTSSIHMMLATYARPEDLTSSTVYHGHPLSDWLDGSNMESDGAVVNHGFMHPDYTASGTLEFNPALMYFLADEPTPQAARHNVHMALELLVTHDYQAGSRPYIDGVVDNKQQVKGSGGTIFKPGTNCSGLFSDDAVVRSDARRCHASSVDAGETFAPGHTRACARGLPATVADLYYPFGTDWSSKRRSNMANFAAQADVFGFDNGIVDSTRHADYWFACYARDVRVMQARHDDGRTWHDDDNYGYYGREGLEAQYGSAAWLAYWIQHQNGTGSIAYENDPYPLEFNRIATYEAEDGDNTLRGTATEVRCGECSGNAGVKLSGTGKANALTIHDVDAPTSGRYNLYIVYRSTKDREIQLTVDGEQYRVNLPGMAVGVGTGVAVASVYLDAGANDVMIEKLSHEGGGVPIIDRVILSP